MDPNGQNNAGTSRDQGNGGRSQLGVQHDKDNEAPHVLLRPDSGKCDGLFVNVVIGMWVLAMLVDTRSDVTILQKQLHDKCLLMQM